jgi:chromosome segregation ATPase
MAISTKITAGQRRQMIAEAAYFRAERRGFAGGDPVADWVQAEAEVDAELHRLEREHVMERLEIGLATATKKLAALKKSIAGVTTEAKAEWKEDVDKLGKLRDTLRTKLHEVRSEGEEAGEKARRQAERAWNEIADIIHRVSSAATRH